MNKVILIGRFTKTPELTTNQNGTSATRFSLACNNDFVNKDGKRDTEFINCVAFNKIAETICKYCDKGRLISAQGRIKNNSYEDQEGNKKYSTNVVIEQLEFLNSSKEDKNETSSHPSIGDNGEADPYAEFGQEINASDLPF